MNNLLAILTIVILFSVFQILNAIAKGEIKCLEIPYFIARLLRFSDRTAYVFVHKLAESR